MPDQAEHDKPENLVESSEELERHAARSLNDAVDSHGTLEGYFAMNNARPPEELDKEAQADRKKRLAKGKSVP